MVLRRKSQTLPVAVKTNIPVLSQKNELSAVINAQLPCPFGEGCGTAVLGRFKSQILKACI